MLNLDTGLIRAAVVLLSRGERLRAVYRKLDGSRVPCLLTGLAEDGAGVLVAAYTEKRVYTREVPIERVDLLPSTVHRLGAIARYWENGGKSSAMREAERFLARVAPAAAPFLN